MIRVSNARFRFAFLPLLLVLVAVLCWVSRTADETHANIPILSMQRTAEKATKGSNPTNEVLLLKEDTHKQ